MTWHNLSVSHETDKTDSRHMVVCWLLCMLCNGRYDEFDMFDMFDVRTTHDENEKLGINYCVFEFSSDSITVCRSPASSSSALPMNRT